MSSVNSILWISSAVVAGLLGAAGIFLISQVAAENRHTLNDDNSEALRGQILSLQQEVETLRELQKKANQSKKKRNKIQGRQKNVSYASDSESVDFRSVIDTDLESDEEYFDVSDDEEDVTLTEDVESVIDEQLLEKIDTLLSGGSDGGVKEAYEILSKLNNSRRSFPNNQLSEILWRLCRCCQRMVNICEQNNDENRKRDVIDEGIMYGKESILYNPENYNAHKWYAVIIGIRSKTKSTAEKIEDGNTYLHHIQEAIKLNPTDAVLFHLQGRFKFEIASLSWFERKAAATIYGNMPSGTYEEALADFKKAEDLFDRDWKENRLYIAKSYFGLKNYEDGLHWLKKAIEVPIKSTDDEMVDIESRELLSKYE